MNFALVDGKDNEYKVIKVDADLPSDVVIPATYRGGSVTAIGSGAFSGCTKLASLSIPSSITSIGANALQGCTALTSIVIPKGVTEISDGLFDGCVALDNVTLSVDTTSIGNGAFASCTALTDITLPSGLISIGDGAFRDCTGITSIVIHDGVANIGSSIFEGNNSVKIFVESDSAKKGWIEGWQSGRPVFYGYDGLAHTYTFEVGDGTLLSDKVITSTTCIELPAGPTMEGFTFSGWYEDAETTGNKIDTLYYNSGDVTLYAGYTSNVLDFTAINDDVVTDKKVAYAIKGKADLRGTQKSVFIPSTYKGLPVTTISANAFKNYTALESIVIPSSINTIDTLAYIGCSAISSISVDNGNETYRSEGNCLIKTADKSVVRGCANSTIPEGIVSIESRSFDYCWSLTKINLPASLERLAGGYGTGAFTNCVSIVEITVAEGNAKYFAKNNTLVERRPLKNAGSGAEYDYTMILGCETSIVPPAEVEFLEADLFYTGSSPSEFCIPVGVETLPAFTFRNSIVSSLYVPLSLYLIESDANYINENDDTHHFSIYFQGTKSEWEDQNRMVDLALFKPNCDLAMWNEAPYPFP